MGFPLNPWPRLVLANSCCFLHRWFFPGSSADTRLCLTVWLHCPLLACSVLPSAGSFQSDLLQIPQFSLPPGVPHGRGLVRFLLPVKMEATKKTRHLLLSVQEMFLWEFFRSSYESAVVRKWDVFGQQLHCTLVRAEAALCGCIILNIMRNQTLIYCCLRA